MYGLFSKPGLVKKFFIPSKENVGATGSGDSSVVRAPDS